MASFRNENKLNLIKQEFDIDEEMLTKSDARLSYCHDKGNVAVAAVASNDPTVTSTNKRYGIAFNIYMVSLDSCYHCSISCIYICSICNHTEDSKEKIDIHKSHHTDSQVIRNKFTIKCLLFLNAAEPYTGELEVYKCIGWLYILI